MASNRVKCISCGYKVYHTDFNPRVKRCRKCIGNAEQIHPAIKRLPKNVTAVYPFPDGCGISIDNARGFGMVANRFAFGSKDLPSISSLLEKIT